MFKTISQLFYSQPEPNQPQDTIKARSYEYKSGENLEYILKFINANHLPVETLDSEPKGFRISAPKETHNALTQHGLVKDKYDRIKFITQALPQSTTGEQVKQAIEEATNLHIISCDKHTVKFEDLKINSNRWYAYAVDDKRKYLNPLQKFFFINQRKYSFDPIGRCRKCWAPGHLTKNCGSNENIPPRA
ncbi:hypothetical protein MP638_002292 [Amoeboaphelidium occidentale]|nr:hypothetical protein MP638_002292 [Amoeboaphelidium occidentale]